MAHWTEKTYIESPAVIGESMHRGVHRAEDEVATLVALLDDHGVEPERALDVACGIGRHSIELAEAGVAVDGVDVSPEYIETARERAADAGVSDKTSFDVADTRELDTTVDEYDVVLNWFAFGYFEDDVNEAIVEKFRERLAPNGALVMGVDHGHSLLGDFQETGASVRRDVIQVERREYSPETGRLEVVIMKSGSAATATSSSAMRRGRRASTVPQSSVVSSNGPASRASCSMADSTVLPWVENRARSSRSQSPERMVPKRAATSVAGSCTPDE